ncbi:MAG: hypothetical protein WBR15_02905 [Gammaproteobacteria bacterium]
MKTLLLGQKQVRELLARQTPFTWTYRRRIHQVVHGAVGISYSAQEGWWYLDADDKPIVMVRPQFCKVCDVFEVRQRFSFLQPDRKVPFTFTVQTLHVERFYARNGQTGSTARAWTRPGWEPQSVDNPWCWVVDFKVERP